MWYNRGSLEIELCLLKHGCDVMHGLKWCSIISLFFFGWWHTALTDDEGVFVRELVGGDLEIQGSRTLANTAGDVVVGAVAGAEPTAKVSSFADGDTAEMSADTCYRQ